MRLFLMCLLLVGCATEQPAYQPENNDEYIEQLRAITDQKIKTETLRTYTYTGVALLVAGVGLLAFAGRYTSGLITSASGAILMTFPFILNSEWFDWVFGIAISIALIDGLYIIINLTKKYISSRKS